jgi:phage terminase Nu1 subunit (DNA packaging protein)
MKISGSDLAKEFGVSRMRISQLTSEGIIAKDSGGKYDVLVCFRAYCGLLRKALAARPVPMSGSKTPTINAARLKLIEAQASMQEIALAKERGQLVSIRDLELAWTEIIVSTKARILAFPRARLRSVWENPVR